MFLQGSQTRVGFISDPKIISTPVSGSFDCKQVEISTSLGNINPDYCSNYIRKTASSSSDSNISTLKPNQPPFNTVCYSRLSPTIQFAILHLPPTRSFHTHTHSLTHTHTNPAQAKSYSCDRGRNTAFAQLSILHQYTFKSL